MTFHDQGAPCVNNKQFSLARFFPRQFPDFWSIPWQLPNSPTFPGFSRNVVTLSRWQNTQQLSIQTAGVMLLAAHCLTSVGQLGYFCRASITSDGSTCSVIILYSAGSRCDWLPVVPVPAAGRTNSSAHRCSKALHTITSTPSSFKSNRILPLWPGPLFFRGKFCQIPQQNLRNSTKFHDAIIRKYPTFRGHLALLY